MRTPAWALGAIVACGRLAPGEPSPGPPPPQGPPAQVWLTPGTGSKLLSREADVHFDSSVPPATLLRIVVDEGTTYQEMVGFGAAITDASAWLIQNKLAPAQREALLQELFGPSPGLGLSFTRLTMGASDFSLHQYSYDDMPAGQTDSALAHFSIDSNRAYVLPVVQRALAINPRLKIMASPWSPPGWMKTTGSLIQGTLLPEAYGPLAEYFRRYIEAYGAEGVPIYAITVQNEPHYEPPTYPGMRLEPPARSRFIGQYLGPLFAQHGIGTIILDWDHNWDEYHGPHAGGCGDCRGVVTIASASGAVTRNVEYYALAHASRFVRPGARRVASTSGIAGLESVAFRNGDDGSNALIVVNTETQDRTFTVIWGNQSFRYTLPAGAVVTFFWS